MTQMTVPAHETGHLRVFTIDLPAEAIERFVTEAGTGEWPLRYALGASLLRTAYVETVAIRDLGAMPLSTYLTEGYGLTGADFKASRPQLDALKGHVLLLPSAAFGRIEQRLTISNPLRWIGTFVEETRPADLTPLRSKSARGTLSDRGGNESGALRGSFLLKALMLGLGVVLLAVLLLAFGVQG
ncbi:aspartate carbamoyltransferase catalytic subunit [Puniceibacterium confluentis]|uniref:aspartate carbamoyltransferase catalytic subunit n=1 Tax=Puniceibacterium confluentis TaxID=1958944 RepID=UPI0011B4D36E|nr:aspartate carbamoyltransferase catalytic subunit [Puniceibacterium confluentis]